jgi:hypothetical protein
MGMHSGDAGGLGRWQAPAVAKQAGGGIDADGVLLKEPY